MQFFIQTIHIRCLYVSYFTFTSHGVQIHTAIRPSRVPRRLSISFVIVLAASAISSAVMISDIIAGFPDGLLPGVCLSLPPALFPQERPINTTSSPADTPGTSVTSNVSWSMQTRPITGTLLPPTSAVPQFDRLRGIPSAYPAVTMAVFRLLRAV